MALILLLRNLVIELLVINARATVAFYIFLVYLMIPVTLRDNLDC